MADVACFCGCRFSFAGTISACPECGEEVTLMTASEFGADATESVCVMHWNGPPSAELVEWDALLAGVAGPPD